MRIISDFHDYYDAVQKVAQDRSVVYLRKRRVTRVKGSWPFPTIGVLYDWMGSGFKATGQVIGFCGRVYPMVQVQVRKPGARTPGMAVCFDIIEVDQFVRAHFRPSQVQGYEAKDRRRARLWPWCGTRVSFAGFFAECEKKRTAYAGRFLDKSCPIFLATPGDGPGRYGKIVWNASLRELEFYRVVDPHTTFQEIQMFLGGLAQPLKEIPSPSDEDLAEAKGFDEWSFRKEPRAGSRPRAKAERSGGC